MLVAVGLVVWFFDRLPLENTSLGIDWIFIHQDIQNGQVQYNPGQDGLRILPWSLPAIIPLGFLSFRSSWGLLTLGTLAVLVLSVPPMPRRVIRLLGIMALVASYLTLRHIADGNLEALVIGGVLLVLWGYRRQHSVALAGGFLLATAKIQETWLFVGIVGVLILRYFPPRKWLEIGAMLALVMAPTLLWKGAEWVQMASRVPQGGGLTDMSLISTLNRLGLGSLGPLFWGGVLVITLIVALRSGATMNHAKAALLLTASMLLAPYTSGISNLTAYAFGVIPLLAVRPLLAVALIILVNSAYFFPYERFPSYSFVVLSFIWLVSCLHMLSERATALIPTPEQQAQILRPEENT